MNRNQLAPAVRDRLQPFSEPFSNYFGVTPLPPPEETIELGAAQAAHRDALECIGRANALAQTYDDHYFLSRILPRQEAVASSAIEGTHSTLDALLELEADDDNENVGDDDALQVRDYARALERSVSNVERNRYDAFSIGLIRDLQREVVSKDSNYNDEPGRLRQDPRDIVYIGGGHISRSIYNPCTPIYVQQCLEDQVNYLRCTGIQQIYQSIVVRMAAGHAHFEAIHPFPDGNGRTGRLLLPLMLSADGHIPLYFAPYIAQNRPAYMDGLRAAQQRLDYVPLIELFSQAIISTVDAVETAHADLVELHANWKIRKKWRKGSTAQKTIEFLIGHPVVTASHLIQTMAVSKQAVNTAIKQLVELRILTEKTGFKRNRVFAAGEALEIYNRPIR